MEQRRDTAPWASTQNCPPSPAVDELSAANFLPPSRRHPSQSLTRMENLSRSLRRQILQRQHDRAHARTRAPLVASLSTYSVRPSRVPPRADAAPRRPRLPFAASTVVLAGADETCAPAPRPRDAAPAPDIEMDPAVAARILRRLRGAVDSASPPWPPLTVMEAGTDTACASASAPDIEIDPAVAARVLRRLRKNVVPDYPSCPHLPAVEIDPTVKAGHAEVDEGYGAAGDDDRGDDEYCMMGRYPLQDRLIGTMKARGIVRFDTSAEAALRCPQLVKNVPRMRKRKHLKREHRSAAQESI